jgi:hypothetical protein
MHFITGENIQFKCDHFVGKKSDFEYNPNVAKFKERFIYIGNREAIDNKRFIFCYTHLLTDITELINTLLHLKNPFKLVFHNSDENFDKTHLILFDKLPLLECVHTQNMNVVHKNVHPLPIGLANSMWPHGNSVVHKAIFEKHVDKDKEIYFNFEVNTNLAKRTECFNAIKSLGIPWSNTLPYKEYLIELKRHKFAICPEGNGIDTHRFYECLYMNVIPICKKNILTEHYSKFFPIVLLNEWEELDVSKLKHSNVNQSTIYEQVAHVFTL